jgi:hypothetical protein
MRVAIATILLLLSSLPAFAAEKAIWSCRTSNADAQPFLHLVEWETRSYVKFAHMRFSALYKETDGMPGWYWHNDGSGFYRYAIVVDEEGKGWYHDFSRGGSEGTSLIDYLLCKRDA